MNNCLRCVDIGKKYFKLHFTKGYYVTKQSKSTETNVDGKGSSSTSSSSSSSSSSDSDEPDSHPHIKNEDKMKKLNELLMQLAKQDSVQESQINLAKPQNQRLIGKLRKEANKVESEEQKITRVVKEVANEIGGDTKSTESELLVKLLNPHETTSLNLLDVIKDMKIDREKTFSDKTRADQVRSILQRIDQTASDKPNVRQRQTRTTLLPQKPERMVQKIELFGSSPLGIFTRPQELKESVGNITWTALQNRDLRLAVTQPPSNYFQQMILWTDQGKLWKFPIDNEQGLDEEKKVHFSQHVFLEDQLDPWCPPKGPLRHFMELVCVGLSKNSYLTVQAKKDHIDWYKNYFENKKALLKEVGAIQDH